MAGFDAMVANVAEAGDIVVLAIALVMTLVVGAALLALDTLVGRVRTKREPKARTSRRPDAANGRGGG
ncbi:MAG: hypothetical protein M3203_16340 [Actinomycetota bacterium]|nr:hypothetical protein [Actinomycetota bacterium]